VARAGLEADVVLLIHLAHPRVEYADRGKSAVHVEDAEGEPVAEEGAEEVET
jgi:hypothetical protein